MTLDASPFKVGKSNKIKTSFEYLWLDGHDVQNVRSKIKIIDINDNDQEILHKYTKTEQALDLIPVWSFDGSSTKQADGENSDCVLKPVKVWANTGEVGVVDFFVLCEAYIQDHSSGELSPHPSNFRNKLKTFMEPHRNRDLWFALEQEYFIMDTKTNWPLGWPIDRGYPDRPQGPYYCGNGGSSVTGRSISEEHLTLCLDLNLEISGTNAEVALSQWEFQLGPLDPLECADQLWFSRFLISRVAESKNCYINFHPKPIIGDWNGSGAHINFSSKAMRECLSPEMIDLYCGYLESVHAEHIEDYGIGNQYRLTGKHETCKINEFRYGVADRGASIRIPPSTALNKKGYLEDRRPSGNVDPYKAFYRLARTLCYCEAELMIKV